MWTEHILYGSPSGARKFEFDAQAHRYRADLRRETKPAHSSRIEHHKQTSIANRRAKLHYSGR